MMTLAALVRWELRLQLRSTRCKVAIFLYLAGCAVPPAIFYFLSATLALGPATFLQNLLAVQPFLTIVLAVLVAGHRTSAPSWAETWPVLASAPVSSDGYLLGRWLAVVSLVLPLTTVPFLVAAALATAAGCEWHEITSWVGSWGLQIVPLVFVTAALWLGSVTILGGEMAALGMTFVGLSLLVALLNRVLFEYRLKIEYSLTLGSFAALARWVELAVALAKNRDESAPWMIESEAPFDARAVAEWVLPRIVVGAGLAALVLTLAIAFVRRSRRDLKPRPIRAGHPLRSYLESLRNLRERLAPAGALGGRERLVIGCGVLLLAGAAGLNIDRQKHFQVLAAERYEAAMGDPIPAMATTVRPQTWTIRGEVGSSGAVSFEIEGTLANEGGSPQTHLAFTLNEHLAVEEVEVDGRRATLARMWDRVGLEVEPPLAAGETIRVRWRVRGTPAEIRFPFRGFGFDTYVRLYDRFRQARFSRELVDLSMSRRYLAVTPRRAELELESMSPLPRYTPWTLVMVERGGGELPEVPEEEVSFEADLEIDLIAPSGFFLADACGTTSHAAAGRLRSGCRIGLGEYMVYGGPLEVSNEGGVVFAALPSHLTAATEYGESLSQAARLSHKAWPGMSGFQGLVVAEWVSEFKGRQRRFSGIGYNLRGRLLLLHESSLGVNYMLWGDQLVADLMTRELIDRRAVEAGQELFFKNLYASLMMQRMGLARQQDATMRSRPTIETVLSQPLLEAGQYSMNHWRIRLPALMFDLQNRIGAHKLFEGIERFLSTSGGEGVDAAPGTVRELFDVLEQESGVELDRFYDDFIAGGAVPKLALGDVASERTSRGFRVTGRIENTGTGEILCPVVVKTEIGSATTLLTVASQASTSFDVLTRARPFRVEIDPEGNCHRLVTPARSGLERIDLAGGAR